MVSCDTASASGITRGILLTTITIINLTSTTIMCLALEFGSGGRFQSVLLGLNGFSSLLPAAYWLHNTVFEGHYSYVRSTAIFGFLTLVALANSIILLIRNDQEEGMALVHDFKMLDHPTRITTASIVLTMLSAFFSLMGFVTAHTGCTSQQVKHGNPLARYSNKHPQSN